MWIKPTALPKTTFTGAALSWAILAVAALATTHTHAHEPDEPQSDEYSTERGACETPAPKTTVATASDFKPAPVTCAMLANEACCAAEIPACETCKTVLAAKQRMCAEKKFSTEPPTKATCDKARNTVCCDAMTPECETCNTHALTMQAYCEALGL